jgi:prevent-host-death family protein
VLRRVGVRELRNQVTAVLRRAEGGERVVVTVAGRPVAQLGPLEPAGPPTIDDLAAQGAVTRARRPDRPAPELVIPVRVGTRLDRLLAEIRA